MSNVAAEDSQPNAQARKERPYELVVTEDRMAIQISCPGPISNLGEMLKDVAEDLKHLGAAEAPGLEALAELCKPHAEGEAGLRDLVLVEGEPPVFPTDSQVYWSRDYFNTDFVIDERTGRIDYRNRMGDPNVKDGELLARITHAVDGTNGHDVFGKTIPAGNPNRMRLRAGVNVRVDEQEDASYFYALADGRVRLSHEGTLSVDEVYMVDGDVGLRTGNISHNGAVIVKGDVQSGSHIVAGGDVEVMGIVEPSQIVAEGNLIVHGGITGEKKSSIKIKGNVRARFIHEAVVEAEGGVHFSKGITNSIVRSLGMVVSQEGQIVGSEVMALGGIAAGKTGSPGSVQTYVIAAEDYSLPPKLAEVDRQMQPMERGIARLHKSIDPLMADQRQLTGRQREAFIKMVNKCCAMEVSMERLQRSGESLKAASQERANPQIVIYDTMYADTQLRINGVSMHVKNSLTGPARAVVSKKEQKIEIKSLQSGKGKRSDTEF